MARPRPRRQLAEPFYYLHNFERVLATLDARYAGFWSDPQRQFLTRFAALPRSARALLVRMAIRAGDLFRARLGRGGRGAAGGGMLRTRLTIAAVAATRNTHSGS